jgi:predicted transport protein
LRLLGARGDRQQRCIPSLVFDRIREIIEAFGTDVTIEGRSTYTPFVRGRQFAAVAAKRDRIDIGLRYTNAPVTTLLAPAKSPGTATHKLSVASLKQVTSEVEKLLRAAYDQNR